MTGFEFLSRDQVLGGLPAKRASLVLFSIESRTSRISLDLQQSKAYNFDEISQTGIEKAFMEALADRRELPSPPTIQDLELYAGEWAALVPDDAGTRAALAHLMGKKYVMPFSSSRAIQEVLGIRSEETAAEYEKLYGEPIRSIFAEEVRWMDKIRWQWARIAGWLNHMPVFWLAFALTLIIGAVTLALPIAVAGIGPLPGIILIVVIGLINMLTVAAMAETASRSGLLRYQNAFIGRVIQDLLGNTSSAIVSLVLTGFSFGLLLIFYLGLSSTLSDATSLPVEVWIGVLFLVGLYFLTRGSLNATVAVTILLTGINVLLLLTMSALAFTRFKVENIRYINLPFGTGEIKPELFAALIGVVLALYSAHILVAVFGKMLLQRDPGGKSVMRGHMSGVGFAIVLNVVWVFAVNGALPPEVLLGQTGTVLVPLTMTFGPVFQIFGTLFVVLSMGLGLIHFSISLFNLVHERLPAPESFFLGKGGHFAVSLVPVFIVFLTAEWIAITGQGSYAAIIGFLGVFVDSLIAGIFPVLLVMASRKKAEIVPGSVIRFIGHPVFVAAVYVLFLGNILVHSAFIWDNPVQVAGGWILSVVVLLTTVQIFRRKSFVPRMVLEVRDSRAALESPRISLIYSGKVSDVAIEITEKNGNQYKLDTMGKVPDFTQIQTVHVEFAEHPLADIRVWVHRLTEDLLSVGLEAECRVTTLEGQEKFSLARGNDQVTLPASGPGTIEIVIKEPE